MTDPQRENPGRTEQNPIAILQLLPNMVTLMGMSFGLTAIRFAIEGRYGTAVLMLLFCALADGLDGLMARRLGAESPMGAQLDSLSDFLCFGVAPAILVYQIHLSQAGGYGWIFALLFAAATCLRLARFNVMSMQHGDEKRGPKLSFVGVPAPSGAFLGMLPVFLTLAGVFPAGAAPLAVSIWLALIGVLMISKLRTPTFAAVKVPRRLTAVILFATVLLIGVSVTRPWFLLIALDLAYLGTVVYALIRARGRLFS